jgi:hypothetical protein
MQIKSANREKQETHNAAKQRTEKTDGYPKRKTDIFFQPSIDFSVSGHDSLSFRLKSTFT